MKNRIFGLIFTLVVIFFGAELAFAKDYILPPGATNPLIVTDEHVYYWSVDSLSGKSKSLKKFNLVKQVEEWSKDFQNEINKSDTILVKISANKLFVLIAKNICKNDYSNYEYDMLVLNTDDKRVLNQQSLILPMGLAWNSFNYDSSQKRITYAAVTRDNQFSEYSLDYNTGEIKTLYSHKFDFELNSKITRLSDGRYILIYEDYTVDGNDATTLWTALIDTKNDSLKKLETGFPTRNITFYKFLQISADKIFLQGPEYETMGVYDITKNTLTKISLGGSNATLDQFGVMRLDDNYLLFTGGLIDGKKKKSVILYDVEKNTSNAMTNKLKHGRYNHSMKWFSEDQILVYGGSTNDPISEYDFSLKALISAIKDVVDPMPFAETISAKNILKLAGIKR